VAINLVHKYSVRILAIDCGLNVKMAIPKAEWSHVQQQVHKIEGDLKQLLPVNLRQAVRWRSPGPVLGIPAPNDQPVNPARSRPSRLSVGGRWQGEQFAAPVPVSSPEDPGQEVDTGSYRPSTRPGQAQDTPVRSRQAVQRTKSSPIEDAAFEEPHAGDHAYSNIVQSLKDKIKQLEKELDDAKTGRSDGGTRSRSREDRIMNLLLPFTTTGSLLDDVTATTTSFLNPTTIASITQRLQEDMHVKLTGLFYPCSSGDDDTPMGPRCASFVLQTSLADYTTVKDRQSELQSILADLLPGKQITWQEVTVGLKADSSQRLSSQASEYNSP
jgi:hypothetical protein